MINRPRQVLSRIPGLWPLQPLLQRLRPPRPQLQWPLPLPAQPGLQPPVFAPAVRRAGPPAREPDLHATRLAPESSQLRRSRSPLLPASHRALSLLPSHQPLTPVPRLGIPVRAICGAAPELSGSARAFAYAVAPDDRHGLSSTVQS